MYSSSSSATLAESDRGPHNRYVSIPQSVSQNEHAHCDAEEGSETEEENDDDDDDAWTGNAFSTRDHPVRLEAFHRNVTTCKIIVALSAVAAIGMNIVGWVMVNKREDWEAGLWRWRIRGMVIPCLVLALLAWSLLSPSNISLEPKKSARRCFRISQYYLAAILFILASIGLILISFQTYHAIDIFDYINSRPSRPVPDRKLLVIYTAKLVISLTFWLSAGLMRRGPWFWYHAPPTELGFGVPSSENPDKRTTEEILNDPKGEPTPNVIDDGGCSCLSFISAGYLAPLMSIVREGRHITESDMPYQPQAHRAFAVLGDAPNDRWKAYQARLGLAKRRSAKLGRSKDGANVHIAQDEMFTRWTLLRTCWDGLWLGVVCSILTEIAAELLKLVKPAMMYLFILQFESGAIKTDQKYALFLALAFMAADQGSALLYSYNSIRENYQQHQVVRLRVEFLLYDKLLRKYDQSLTLKPQREPGHAEQQPKNSAGQKEILRLVGVDSDEIASITAKVIYPLFRHLMAIAFGTAFMARLLGWATLGISANLASGPLAALLMRYTYRRDREYAAAQDDRIRAVRSALSMLKVLKLNGWDAQVRERLAGLRNAEMKACYQAKIGSLGIAVVSGLFSDGTLILVLGLYILGPGKNVLTASAVFPILSLFLGVKAAIAELPNRVDSVLRSLIGIDRLVHFLNSATVPLGEVSTTLDVNGATIGFPQEADHLDIAAPFELLNVSLHVPQGCFVLICGPTASGKSLLLQSLLGEARISQGWIHGPNSNTSALQDLPTSPFQEDAWIIPTAVAYTPQRPLIFHSTVQGNILNGLPLWGRRFADALTAAALDLADFPDLEETEIGEGGHNISIGQAARIAFARAVYSRANSLYLDDLLASVDAQAARRIVQAFASPILARRTIIMTSDHMAIARTVAHQIVTLGDGRVLHTEHIRTQRPGLESINGEAEGCARGIEIAEAPTDLRSKHQLVREESRQLGGAKNSHVWDLLRYAGGVPYYAVLFLVVVGHRSIAIGCQEWVRKWTSSSDGPPGKQHSQAFYLCIYAILVLTQTTLERFRQWSFVWRFVRRVPAVIHDSLVGGIFGTSLQTQEGIPLGRMLNRFIEDMATIDGQFSPGLDAVMNRMVAVTLMTLILVWSAPKFGFIPLLLLPLLKVAYTRLVSLKSDTKRISRIAGSPIVSLYNVTLGSITLIRAFGTQSAHMASLIHHQTAFRRLGVVEYMAYNYFRAILSAVSSFLFSSVLLFLVWRPELSAPEVGLLLNFSHFGAVYFFQILLHLTELGSHMVAVERIAEYQALEPEEDPKKIALQPASDWPSTGHILVENLNVRYADDLPDVLRDISFEIAPRERIGVVGHTGHGKSTLALSLFRAVKSRTGRIIMNGVNIEDVSLQTLRSGLSMIPQEGLLNDGTLRDALDITGEIDDAELYDALRQVQLIPAEGAPSPSNDQDSPASAGETTATQTNISSTASLPGTASVSNPDTIYNNSTTRTEAGTSRFANLSTSVSPGGSNFSAGERQLLCLARALLKPRAIMVFDEATSSVDAQVDAKIKHTIKNSFRGSTMFVIAHRLATIIDFDRVMVIQHGKVIEFDTPSNLLANKDSAFYALASASGEDEVMALL